MISGETANEWWISCDGCPEKSAEATTCDDAVDAARLSGWICDTHDLCPACQAKALLSYRSRPDPPICEGHEDEVEDNVGVCENCGGPADFDDAERAQCDCGTTVCSSCCVAFGEESYCSLCAAAYAEILRKEGRLPEARKEDET